MSEEKPVPNNDICTPAFWREVAPGDILLLSDEKTLKAKMAAGGGVEAEEYSINAIKKVEITNARKQKIAEYILLNLIWTTASAPSGRNILAKLIDNAVGISLYDEANDWDPATRKALLEADCTFLWEPPSGDWTAMDLKYIDLIRYDKTGVEYMLKPQGELSGQLKCIPGVSGADRHIATIAEYAACSECEHPELAVVEIGEGENGLIKLLLGRPLSLNDVEILNRAKA